jgi:Undecaprenyl-phosphate glucose phosphotransferase
MTSVPPMAERRRRYRPKTHRLTDRARSVATAFRNNALAPSLVSGVAAGFEFSALAVAGVFAGWAFFGSQLLSLSVLGPALGAAFLTILALYAGRSYEIATMRSHQTRLARVLIAWTSFMAIVTLTLVLTDAAPHLPRSWYPFWYSAGVFTAVLASAVTSATVTRLTAAGRLHRRVVIVGGGARADSVIAALEKTGSNEVRIIGIFDDRSVERTPVSQTGYPNLGNISDLVQFARVASVDLFIVSLPIAAEKRLLQILKQLWVLPVDIRLAAGSHSLRFRPRSYSYIGSVPLLDIFDKPIAGWDSVIKRAFDLVLVSLSLVVLSPVMVATAIAIRMDSSGPLLFRQKRYGFNNEVIEVLKFRSMFQEATDPGAKHAVTRGDPRVTRVGRFMRRTSIDELPQLINVLRGELSLVGPRPHAVNAHTSERLWEEVVDGYFARHRVKPGVTGWAQINGWRGEVDTPDKIQRRVEHDLHYIENWSVFFDLYILMLTPLRILDQENAY